MFQLSERKKISTDIGFINPQISLSFLKILYRWGSGNNLNYHCFYYYY